MSIYQLNQKSFQIQKYPYHLLGQPCICSKAALCVRILMNAVKLEGNQIISIFIVQLKECPSQLWNLVLIFREILARNGSVADSALATLFCNGILTMQSMGIGGGFVMNIYIHAEKKAYTLNAKETSPAAATSDMFKTFNDSIIGN